MESKIMPWSFALKWLGNQKGLVVLARSKAHRIGIGLEQDQERVIRNMVSFFVQQAQGVAIQPHSEGPHPAGVPFFTGHFTDVGPQPDDVLTVCRAGLFSFRGDLADHVFATKRIGGAESAFRVIPPLAVH